MSLDELVKWMKWMTGDRSFNRADALDHLDRLGLLTEPGTSRAGGTRMIWLDKQGFAQCASPVLEALGASKFRRLSDLFRSATNKRAQVYRNAWKNWAHNVDLAARAVVPATFLVCCVVLWAHAPVIRDFDYAAWRAASAAGDDALEAFWRADGAREGGGAWGAWDPEGQMWRIVLIVLGTLAAAYLAFHAALHYFRTKKEHS